MCVPGGGLDTGLGRVFPLCTCDCADHHVGAVELKEAADTARTQHRSEKQRRKQLELRLSSLEEELQDLKTEKEGLGRVRRL